MRRLTGFRSRRAAAARRVTMAAGLVLASSFFMPAITACNSNSGDMNSGDIIPICGFRRLRKT